MGNTVFGPAVVLHRRHLNENSDVLMLLSPKWGRVDAVCSGLNKADSALRGKVEPFTEFEGLFIKSRSSMLRLTQAKALRMRTKMYSDYDCICWGAYLAELFVKSIEGEELPASVSEYDYRRLYKIFNSAVDGLSDFPHKGAAVSIWVLLKVLKILGICPDLFACTVCGKEAEYFNFSVGGALCSGCGEENEGTFFVKSSVWNLIRSFDSCSLDAALLSKHTASDYAAAEHLLWRQLVSCWNISLKSRTLLKIGGRSLESFRN